MIVVRDGYTNAAPIAIPINGVPPNFFIEVYPRNIGRKLKKQSPTMFNI